jgi:hypothetical protein
MKKGITTLIRSVTTIPKRTNTMYQKIVYILLIYAKKVPPRKSKVLTCGLSAYNQSIVVLFTVSLATTIFEEQDTDDSLIRSGEGEAVLEDSIL